MRSRPGIQLSKSMWRPVSLHRAFQGEAENECRSLSRLAEEIDLTIVQLHDSECHGQTDARALHLGRKIKLENFLPLIRWNAAAGVRDTNLGLIPFRRGFEA